MCETCGCSDPNEGFIISDPSQKKTDENSHLSEVNHSHGHGHGEHAHGKIIDIETDVLSKNNLIAERNRGYFEAKGIKCFNLVSSPGSGKTTLLETLIKILKDTTELFVIEGDQQTTNDAERIEKTGVKSLQINTGNGCHLDANMINVAVKKLNPSLNSYLFIENVGNLVCPALFDLGEGARIVVSSITEGEDKPLKYPNMFETSQLCVVNKIDLLPYINFSLEKHKEYALRVNHHLDIIEISATTGKGIDNLVDWLKNS